MEHHLQLNISEFLSTLPQDVMKGKVEIPDKVLKKCFTLQAYAKGIFFYTWAAEVVMR